jgi:stage II sporulation protein D
MPAPRPPTPMPSPRLALAVVLAAALLLPAGASPQGPAVTVDVTTFVITGHGWGHGVGMAQWGAYGYAKHGVSYDRILAHYYPGTTLAPASVSTVNVLMVEGAARIVVSSPDPFSVRDAAGAVHKLAGGNYPLDATLAVKTDPAKPAKGLPGPLTFLPGKSPVWLRNPYRGTLTVSASGNRLTVVNTVGLEAYTRGVVSSEMPHDWPLEAVKAQAVAARSYALAHRRGGPFDVYNDTRDQVYGGIAAETPVGDEAVAGTKRQVLLYAGKVASTYFFSSSGGRTAAITDVFTGAKPTPYLVSVRDPYDTYSPYHNWGPVAVIGSAASKALRIAGVDALRPVPPTGHAKSVVVSGRNGDVTVPASDVRRALGLRSTWMTVGLLSLSRPLGVVPEGSSVTISGKATQVQNPVLEQRSAAGGDWQTGPALSLQPDGSFSVDVWPTGTMLYRLSAGTTKSAALRVPVAGT